ncbi:MAG: methyltransferase [Lysobacterales bacterium]
MSQLLLRNTERLAAGEILLFNPPPDHLFQQWVATGRQVRIFSQDYDIFRWFSDSGAQADFSVLPDATTLPSQIILYQPREKERLDMLLHFLAASLPSGGNLWLAGDNASGIKSAGKRLGQFFGQFTHIDSARHGALFQASQPTAPAAFTMEHYQRKWMLGDPTNELRMVSLPGAFAHGRLDRGTLVLLGALEQSIGKERPSGSVLDFGCGIGVIGLKLLLREPSIDLTLLDNSALALESARLSMQANGLEARLLPSSGLCEVGQRFDWIVSNPPFHRGVATHYDIARDFFTKARHVLTRQGKILLVCNRHLPYEDWLREQFGQVDEVHGTNEFKVLCALRPKS